MNQPNPQKRVATNIESWRKRAVQVVVVRHGTSGGVHAEMAATCGTPETAMIVVNELAKFRPEKDRIYAFGPSEKGAIAPKLAIEKAVADYLNGGLKGIPGKLL